MAKKAATMKDESPFFIAFWAVWKPYARHTDGRGLAREAFNKHVRNGANPQDIVDGAKAFFRTMKDRDREYVPLSATWLNRESFMDLAEAQRDHERRMQEAQSRRVEQIKQQASAPAAQAIDPAKRAEMAARAKAALRGVAQ